MSEYFKLSDPKYVGRFVSREDAESESEMHEEWQKEIEESRMSGRDRIDTKRIDTVMPREPEIEIIDVKEESVKLDWTVEEKRGWEVKVFTEDYVDRMMDTDKDDNEAKTKIIESLPNLIDLEDGKIVLVMSIMGWVAGNVRMGTDLFGSPHVESGGHIFPLSMSEDSRNCWVTSSQINKSVFDLIRRR